jgi:glycerol kinase
MVESLKIISVCSIQSDILKIDISRPVVSETTALGAAYAAGLAVGIWPDLDALRSQWRESARWTPDRTSDLAQGGYQNCRSGRPHS